MATTILPGGHSHFDQGSQFYASDLYHDFNQPSTVMLQAHTNRLSSNTPKDSISLATAQSWPSQISGRRASSKSPNVTERTPIRHTRHDPSRTRSTGGSEALLAYATEQALQQQQRQSLNTPSVLEQTTPLTSPLFSSQAFSSLSPTSPFLQQQSYYDNATSGFQDLQNQHIGHGVPSYYSSTRNDIHTSPLSASSLTPQEALYMRQAGQVRTQTMANMSPQTLSFPTMPRQLETSSSNAEASGSRNKPQCWDHGCNGRQFSTFSNLLRHQREKSGTATKARCPHCGTEFTRTTARNGHMYGGKCKGMPDASKRSSVSESVDYSD